MSPEGFDEFLHGIELAAHGPGAPLLEEPTCPVWTVILPERIEGLFEQIGSNGPEIEFEQVLEFRVLPGGEVFRAFEEAVTGSAEHGIEAVTFELFGFDAPDFIDGFTEFFDDMETVQDIERGRQHRRDDVEVGLPHVGANDFDPGASLGAEVLEEAGEGLDLALLDDAEQSLATLVDLIDEGQVFVAFAVGDFIDADRGDVLQVPVFESVVDDPFYRTADGIPGGVETGCGLLPAQPAGPSCEEMAEDIATGVLALSPRHGFDLDAAGRAFDPAHGVRKDDGNVPDGNEFEGSGLGHPIITGTWFPTTGASGLAVGSRQDFGDNTLGTTFGEQCDRMVNEALERLDFIE